MLPIEKIHRAVSNFESAASSLLQNRYFAFMFIAAFFLLVLLLARFGDAQTSESKINQKETGITKAGNVQNTNTETMTDKEAIRSFRINIPEEALSNLTNQFYK